MDNDQTVPRVTPPPTGAAAPLKKLWREPRLVLEGTLESLTRQATKDDPVFGPFGASPAGGTGGLNCT